MSNITFDIKCIRADPQAGICEVGGSGGGSGSSTSNISATVRGSTSMITLPNAFQTVSPATLTRVNFMTVVSDTNSLWDAGNFRYTIPAGESGNYLLVFGLTAPNTLQGVVIGDVEQIFEWIGFFRILNSDGTTKEDYGKTTTYGGVSPSINSIAGTTNYTYDLTIGSSIILPLLEGEHIQVFTIYSVNFPMTSLPLFDPSPQAGSVMTGPVTSSWFSIKKV